MIWRAPENGKPIVRVLSESLNEPSIYRVSTVYQPYIYRVCTVVASVRTEVKQRGNSGRTTGMYDL